MASSLASGELEVMPRGLMLSDELSLAGEASMPHGLMQSRIPLRVPLRFLRGRRSEILNLLFPMTRSVAADDQRPFPAHLLCVHGPGWVAGQPCSAAAEAQTYSAA